MEKKVFNSVEEEEKDFENMLNQAAQIKSYQMSLERQKFDKLPDFYKEGLYNYNYLKNIYKQSYNIKKYTYEAIKLKGIQHLKFKEYENALDQFIKSICIFKYIECSNPKWNSGDGIKDNELKYIDYKGNNELEANEIIKMIKSSLLNISLVYYITKEYKNVREACDEVLKIDPNCVKAYYRKAKSFMDDPKSLISEHIEAQKILEIANKIDPNNIEIRNTLEKFNKQLNDERKSEKKTYKSYYNKINKETKNTEKEKKEEEKKMKEEKNSGLPQIRMMDLLLEICYTQKNLYERQDMKKEMKKLDKVIKQAKKYRDDLNDLINIDFNNPNEKLINLSKKEGFDLKDTKIQQYFNDLKLKLIGEINEFHESNLNLMKGQNDKNINRYNELKNQINKDDKDKKNEINFNEDEKYMFNKNNINNTYKRNINNDDSAKNKNINKNDKNNSNTKDIKNNTQIINKNNEQLKNTLKLAFSGIFVFLCFYLLKFGLGYYLRNKLDIDI